MKKYYITCGDIKNVLHAHTAPQAIFKTLDNMPSVEKLSTIIKTSEIGHDKHPEDELFLLCDMFALWLLNKAYIEGDNSITGE